MAMKRIAAMLLASVLLLSCVGCAQDGRKEPDAEKTDLGLTAEVKPATDFTAKAKAAVARIRTGSLLSRRVIPGIYGFV